MGGAGGPLLDDEVIADVEPPGAEGDVGPRGEDARDVLAHRGPFGYLAGGVVLEHHVRRVQIDDGVDVMPVPGVVVTVYDVA
jgi:hypothetical protein